MLLNSLGHVFGPNKLGDAQNDLTRPFQNPFSTFSAGVINKGNIQCLSNAFSHDALNILQPYFNLPTCAQGINSVRFINFIVRKHYFLTLCTDHATNVQTNLKIEGLYTLKTFAQMGLHSQRIFCFRQNFQHLIV